MDSFRNKDFDSRISFKNTTAETQKKIVIPAPSSKKVINGQMSTDLRNDVTSTLNEKYKR